MNYHTNPNTGKVSECRAKVRCRFESTSVDNPSVELVDSDGNYVPVTPGVIDQQSRYVYARGQCLAFAQELALSKGWGVKTVSMLETYSFDDEPYSLPVHVYADSGDGRLWDFEGSHDAQSVRTRWEQALPGKELKIESYSSSEVSEGKLHDSVGAYMEDQDYGTAKSFVTPFLSRENL